MKETMRKWFQNKIVIKQPLVSLFLVLGSLAVTILMLLLQTDGTGDVIACIRNSNGLMLLLNYLPVLLFMVLVYYLSANLVLGLCIPAFVFLVMGYINRMKVILRNDPFLPWDISLGGEVLGIAKSFDLRMVFMIALLIAAYLLFSAVAWKLIKNDRPSAKIRIGGVLCSFIAGALLNLTLYQNFDMNQKLYIIGNPYNSVNTFNSKGFLYSFIFTHNTNQFQKPGDYSTQGVMAVLDQYEKAPKETFTEQPLPHIIMIMGEAFSEMALNPIFDFTGFTDPLENFKMLKEQSVYGEIVVANLGGGTADTEFDVLTGLSTRHLRGGPYSYRLVTNEFEALPWVLNSIGYRSVGMHPGHPWFYNRQNVFTYFGMEETLFIDAFSEEEKKSMYISDAAATDKIMEQFENHLRDYPDTPFFEFCVTIQNHGPYKDRYGDISKNFNTDISFDADDMNAIKNYFHGLIDADQELMRLIEYFEQSEEPVVVVFFGDHLPAFNPQVYQLLYPDDFEEGSMESLSMLYKTPFLIWQNEVAEKSTSILENADLAIMPEDMVISANYLGAYLLELLGYSGISPFFDYINEVRGQFPVIFETQSFSMDKTSTMDIEIADKESLITYRNWEFYKIFDERYVPEAVFDSLPSKSGF